MEIFAGLFLAGLLGFLWWIFIVKGLSLDTYVVVLFGGGVGIPLLLKLFGII
jgi:hypothetical protein